MNRYEGLFILNSVRDEVIKETIDKISAEINMAGGRVETVQKMERRPFSRVANKKNSAGFYVNFIFETNPSAVAPLRAKLALNEDIFRAIYTSAPKPVPGAAAIPLASAAPAK